MIGKKVIWYERNIFSTEQLFDRTVEMGKCMELIARKMYYYNADLRAQELDDFWVKKPENRATASLASPWGFYVGMDEIRKYYVDKHGRDRMEQLDNYRTADPGFSGQPGYGASLFRTANTPVVYIAEDGRTAQGMWFVAGQETIGEPGNKAAGFHIFGRAGVDFIKEDGEWKIWHWADVYDLSCPVGEKVNELPMFPAADEEPFRIEFESGEPTVKMTTHFSHTHSADGWPAYPFAHATYNPNNSYGPEGHPGLRDDCMDVNWEARMAVYEAWGR